MHDTPKALGTIILEKRGTKHILDPNLAHFDLVYIKYKWHYDPDGYLIECKVKVSHIS